jgi:hypothetical protein
LGINIWEEYNITVILENDGIIPGASYNRERIRDAILTKYDVKLCECG